MKAAFIFLTLDQITKSQNFKSIELATMQITLVGANSYDDAIKKIQSLIEQGYTTIELCAGFGHQGVAIIQASLPNHISLGVVRFDLHPSLNMQSGDKLFSI